MVSNRKKFSIEATEDTVGICFGSLAGGLWELHSEGARHGRRPLRVPLVVLRTGLTARVLRICERD
jgi:hypothetical protein